MLDYKDIIIRHYALSLLGSEIARQLGVSKSGEYYGSNVPLFRRNGYQQSGATIP